MSDHFTTLRSKGLTLDRPSTGYHQKYVQSQHDRKYEILSQTHSDSCYAPKAQSKYKILLQTHSDSC